MQTVHVRVNDAATGKPTACRVRFTDTLGKYHFPLGRRGIYSEGNVVDGQEIWSYIDGACEIELPPGPISIAIRKGIEYTPLDTTLELLPGKMAMRFTLERWTNWCERGWYAGDGRGYVGGPHNALLQAAGEDLAVVNLLAEERQGVQCVVPFSGQKPCLEVPGHMVVVNTHNVDVQWGSLGLLNCHRVVYPLLLHPAEKGDWTLQDWCDQCHRKQGLVVWTDDDGKRSRLATETLANLVLGKVDAFELTWANFVAKKRVSYADWCTLLDAGLKVPLIGSSAARNLNPLLGRPRTYCALGPGETLTYGNWIEAIRAGRTFVTTGPLVDFTVDGKPPGSVIDLPHGRKTVTVQTRAESPLPFARVELICNNEVAGQAVPQQEALPWSAELSQEVNVAEGGWLIAQCWSREGQLLARTSPVYVSVRGKVPPQRLEAREKVADILAKLLARARKKRALNERLVHVLENARATLER